MTYSKTVALIAALILAFAAVSRSQDGKTVELDLSAKSCIQGMAISPPPMWITIFDASKVPDLLDLMQDFRANMNPQDAAGGDKMLDIYDTLYKQVKKTPALYRSTLAVSGEKMIKVPPTKRLVIFAFGDDEGNVTSLAEQEIEPSAGSPNKIVLNFASESECPKQ